MIETKKSMVANAASEYAKGNYLAAIEIYKQLSLSIGLNLFYANIKLCERRLRLKENDNKNFESLFLTSFADDDKAEILITWAKKLIRESRSANQPVDGRVAVVGRDVNNIKYVPHVKKTAFGFQKNGWETLCMMSSFGIPDNEFNINFKKKVDGIFYLQNFWSQNLNSNFSEVGLKTQVEIFSEWLSSYKPQVLVAVGSFTSTLPAIIAAKQLSVPVIKKNLNYSNIFNENEADNFLNLLSSKKYFALEQFCSELADNNYYACANAENDTSNLLKVVGELCKNSSVEQSLAVLKRKDFYTITQSIKESGIYYLELGIEDSERGDPRGIVGSFRFYGASGKLLTTKFNNFSSSKDFPQYSYIDTSANQGTCRVLVFDVPEEISRIDVDIVAFVTSGSILLRHAQIGKVTVDDVARWLSKKASGISWIKSVESFIHKEGAISLRLALLNYKYQLSGKSSDKHQIDTVIDELLELNPFWLPELATGNKKISLKSTEKITVLHLHKTAYPYENTGGAIRCLNTVLSQKRIGIDPYIITPIGYPRSAGFEGAKNHEVIEGIDHFRIGANTDGLRGISFPDRNRYTVFHIAKILKRRGASVIHAASGIRGYELALQALALKKITGLPLVYEVRSFHEHTWTSVRNDVMDLEKTQLRVIKENSCMAQADFVTTISFSMKNILIERGVPEEKIEVIPNAIDESKYLNKKFLPISIPVLKGADIVVGYVSNMSIREGHEYLIRAIYKLRKCTGLDIRGLLVGNGPELAKLERLAEDLGMKNLISFPGEVDHSLINEYYKAIDLFVIPRIPDYAADWVTPLKPYEAMALERPIIVSDLPALKEIVGENEERGLIAQPADVDSLVTQLQRYIDDPVLRKSKVDAAREWVFTERTWSSNAKRYESIYRRLIANQCIAK